MVDSDQTTEHERLLVAVAALESQRPALGDAVVEVALAPLLARVAELGRRSTAPRPALPGERKVVTTIFVDVSGFTAMSERLDSEEVRDIINGLFARLVPVIESFGGVIDRFSGDGIMALFGAPAAAEHHAEQALRACLALFTELARFNEDTDQQLGLHIGVNSGMVVAGAIGSSGVQQYSVMGDAANVAARLEDASESGEILVGPATYRMTADLFDFVALAPVHLKGKATAIPVYRLLESRPRPIRTTTGVDLPFVGRHGEIERITGALRRAAPTVAVIGDAGLGKSRLLVEARRSVPAAPWFEVSGLLHRASTPYSTIRDLLDDVIGAPPGADGEKWSGLLRDHLGAVGLGADEELASRLIRLRGHSRVDIASLDRGVASAVVRERVTNSVGALLRATLEGSGAVVCIEDLHWVDASSIDVLADMIQRSAVPGVAIVGTGRPGDERLRRWLDAVGAVAQAEIIELRPLSSEDSAAALDMALQAPGDSSALRRSIAERAEGNPFYIASFLRTLVDDGLAELIDGSVRLLREPGQLRVPESLHAVVGDRIDRLDPVAKQYLRLASVIGRRFDPALLDAVAESVGAPGDPGALDRLIERQMIEPSGLHHLQFVHAIVQDVAYDALLGRDRRSLHRAVVTAMQTRGARDMAAVAWHLERAGLAEEASQRYAEAADQAAQVYAHDVALQHAMAARRLASPADHVRREALGEQIADLLHLVGRFADAVAELEGLTPVDGDLSAADDPGPPAAYAAGVGVAMFPDVADGAADVIRRLRKQARSLLPRQRFDDAVSRLDRARDLLERVPPPARGEPWEREFFAVEAEAMWALYMQGRSGEMRLAAERLAPLINAKGTAVERGLFRRSLALLELRVKRFRVDPDVVELARTAVDDLAGTSDQTSLCFAEFTHAFTLLWSGQHAQAETRLVEVLDRAQRIGDAERRLLSLTYLAVVGRLRGDIAGTEAFAYAARSLAQSAQSALYTAVAEANLGWASWRRGDDPSVVDAALERADRVLATLPSYPIRWMTGLLGLARSVAEQDLDRARVVCVEMAGPGMQLLLEPAASALLRAVEEPTESSYAALLQAAETVGYL